MSQNELEDYSDEKILDEWIDTHNSEDYCEYCIKNDNCRHCIACYGGEPIEPYCCSVADIKELLDTERILDDIREAYTE